MGQGASIPSLERIKTNGLIAVKIQDGDYKLIEKEIDHTKDFDGLENAQLKDFKFNGLDNSILQISNDGKEVVMKTEVKLGHGQMKMISEMTAENTVNEKGQFYNVKSSEMDPPFMINGKKIEPNSENLGNAIFLKINESQYMFVNLPKINGKFKKPTGYMIFEKQDNKQMMMYIGIAIAVINVLILLLVMLR